MELSTVMRAGDASRSPSEVQVATLHDDLRQPRYEPWLLVGIPTMDAQRF